MMKLEMTATIGDTITVTFDNDKVTLNEGQDFVTLHHDDISALCVLLTRYKSALKEAHGG
jgi:hypothetical protein